jgi:uncharacterized DUF497 family protein
VSIEFDRDKDAQNLAKHGVSLGRAAEFVAVAVEVDDRFDYVEPRFRAYGHIDGIAHCLVYTVRGQNIRAISLRRAHAKEMKRHAPQSSL